MNYKSKYRPFFKAFFQEFVLELSTATAVIVSYALQIMIFKSFFDGLIILGLGLFLINRIVWAYKKDDDNS